MGFTLFNTTKTTPKTTAPEATPASPCWTSVLFNAITHFLSRLIEAINLIIPKTHQKNTSAFSADNLMRNLG
jgi:hypothetical protein